MGQTHIYEPMQINNTLLVWHNTFTVDLLISKDHIRLIELLLDTSEAEGIINVLAAYGDFSDEELVRIVKDHKLSVNTV